MGRRSKRGGRECEPGSGRRAPRTIEIVRTQAASTLASHYLLRTAYYILLTTHYTLLTAYPRQALEVVPVVVDVASALLERPKEILAQESVHVVDNVYARPNL